MFPKVLTGLVGFPALNDDNHQVTSPRTVQYNCIAWAVGFDDVWWWPDSTFQFFWPKGVKREATVERFVEAFQTVGYVPCNDGVYEKGFQKIVLYTSSFSEPKHAAKQINETTWASKLGQYYDIEHELNALDGDEYGKPTFFFKKKV